jgi:hypothetical protein
MSSGPLRQAAAGVALLLLVPGARGLQAQQVYQSVDAAGHLTYSDEAPIASPTTEPPALSSQPDVAPSADAPDVGTLPQTIHFCWTNCFTLILNDGFYTRADGSPESWTVERFTAGELVLHRHDEPAAWNGFSRDVIYQGEFDHDRLTKVSVNGHPAPDIQAAWGIALESLPGSNQERDQRRLAGSSDPSATLAASSPGEGAGSDADLRANEAPPPLPADDQPPIPDEGYLWTPGYWAWSPGGYWWVSGAWVRPPRFGVLWTPGYWAFAGGVYAFHPGYWGAHVGYYGGVNYGFGYAGVGYRGGRWVGDSFAYNSAVNHLGGVIHNTYRETVVDAGSVNRVSYNGGPGGIVASPNAQERQAAAEPHIAPTPLQREAMQRAFGTRALVAHSSDARTGSAAMPRTTAFTAPHGSASAMSSSHGVRSSSASHASSASRTSVSRPLASRAPPASRPAVSSTSSTRSFGAAPGSPKPTTHNTRHPEP